MFALIESLRDLPSQHRIHGAHHYQHDGVAECNHVGRVYVAVAHEQVVLSRGVVVHGARWGYYHPHSVYHHLENRSC